MRVLMVTEQYPPDCDGGGGWSTYTLAKSLHESEGIEVKVLALNQEKVKESVPVEKIDVARLPNEIPYYRIKKEVDKRKEDFDVVFGQDSLTIPPLAFVDGIKTVGIIRNYWPVCYKVTLMDNWGNRHKNCGLKCIASVFQDFAWKTPYKFYNHHFRSKVSKKLDLLIARTHFVKERLQDKGYHDNIEVVYSLIDKEQFRVDETGDKILHINPSIHKGIDVTLKTAEMVPDEEFIVAGKEPDEKWVSRKMEELDNVEFIGFTNDMREVYRDTKIVLMPSQWYEPYGRVPVEAGFSGIPTIAPDYGGLKESVGLEELLVDENDSELYAEKIKEINEDYGRFSEVVKEEAEKKTAEKQLEKVKRILEEVVC